MLLRESAERVAEAEVSPTRESTGDSRNTADTLRTLHVGCYKGWRPEIPCLVGTENLTLNFGLCLVLEYKSYFQKSHNKELSATIIFENNSCTR